MKVKKDFDINIQSLKALEKLNRDFLSMSWNLTNYGASNGSDKTQAEISLRMAMERMFEIKKNIRSFPGIEHSTKWDEDKERHEIQEELDEFFK